VAYNKRSALALAAIFAVTVTGLSQSQAGDRRAHGNDVDGTQARASDGLPGPSLENSVYVSRWEADRPHFPNRWLVTPNDRVGAFYEPHLSCWTWVPMNSGWRRVWECKHPGRAFAPHGPFVPPFTPISAFYAYGPSYPSCWIRLPRQVGWRRTWVCDWPYGLGYDYD
jgi:hypothetical protein